ncbi:MAG: phosphoribosylformylglycinamidine synthase I [Bacteroidales bacterium]|nr:phosphoribosylformylglycinamidine synthase I [Bacteroidales bacterium]
MATPRVAILRAPGTNCDEDTAYAFRRVGATTTKFHINALRANPERCREFQILVVPGGFSYGDDVAAGKILATQMQQFLGDALREFRDQEKLILGICNGFQVLLKAGLIVPADEEGPMATLTHNTTGRYEDRWVHLRVTPGNCPFLTGLDRLEVPVAHGEGNFICRKEWILKGLAQSGQAVLRYCSPAGGPASYPQNPNGSQDDIAGVCDATGRVLGLMPHPERHILPTQNPNWTRTGLKPEGDGLALFRNAVHFFQ